MNRLIVKRTNTFQKLFESQLNIHFQSGDTCAVVANSGILLNEEYGFEIDQHDCVVRMNAAPTKGYHNHVGSKQTFRILNGPLQECKTPEQVSTPDDYITSLKGERLIMGRTTDKKRLNGIMKTVNHNQIYIPSHQVNYNVNRIEKSYGMRFMSTGMYTLIMFCTFFDTVNTYGFNFHQDDVSTRHYWEPYKEEHNVNHQWEDEKKLYQDLEKKGHIRINR